MAINLLIPRDRAAIICPSPIDWMAPGRSGTDMPPPETQHDCSDDKRREIAETDPGEYAEPEEEEQDEDGETRKNQT